MSAHPEADRLVGKRVRITDCHTAGATKWVGCTGEVRAVVLEHPPRVAIVLDSDGTTYWADPKHLEIVRKH